MAQARRYRLLSVLGQGGFGTVYRARLLGEGGFSKPVALKVLNPELAMVGELARRLRDEARVLGLVQHRAIVKVDALVQLDGRWTVVMEYVEGRDLKTILEQGPIPLGPALEIAAEVAGALHAAYNATGPDDTPLHLLHRDIKPANICVTALGEVKVLDFGIARAEFGDRESKTQSQAYGTPDYMAPERFLFENGPEADLYAVGATLYEMLMGTQLGRASPRERVHAELLEGRLQLLADTLGPAHADVIELLRDLLGWEPLSRPTAREAERRLTRLRHGKEGALLRDWAEGALPGLVAAQESRVDGATGTMLIEGDISGDEPSQSRSAWPGPLPASGQDSATFALPAVVESGETLVVPEVAPEPPVTPPPAPPTAPPPAQSRVWPMVVGMIGGGILLALYDAWRATPSTGATDPTVPAADTRPAEPPLPAPEPAAPEPAAPEPAAPEPTLPTPKRAAPESAPTATTIPSTSATPSTTTLSTSAPTAAAPASSASPTGRWEGSMNGRPMDLVLRGSGGALSGEVMISFGPSTVSSTVRGTWDSDSRTLQLEDVEQTEDAGAYTATLNDDGTRMSGSFHALGGGTIVRFTVARSGS